MQLHRTNEFMEWLQALGDRQGRAKIIVRLDRLEQGNPGNSRSVGEGIFELKIDFGPGYRVYYVQRGEVLIVILCGGDKSTQSKDIQRAKTIASQLSEEEKNHVH
jgi:putative addiction module killer protein